MREIAIPSMLKMFARIGYAARGTLELEAQARYAGHSVDYRFIRSMNDIPAELDNAVAFYSRDG